MDYTGRASWRVRRETTETERAVRKELASREQYSEGFLPHSDTAKERIPLLLGSASVSRSEAEPPKTGLAPRSARAV